MKASDMLHLTKKLDAILSELDDLRAMILHSTYENYEKNREEE
jgi:hypothetical protein|tara:strand:+ start:358 stop:486 length:129 start_codon:yes stop_codon:yes gene_type:complete